MDNNFFNLGDNLFEEGKFNEAFAMFLSGAKNGDVSGMTRVGSMYVSGEGVTCDDEAISWELKAIVHGDATQWEISESLVA